MDAAQIPLRGLRRPSRWPAALPPLLAAALLRALPLLDNRFHPDEALYAGFARLIASGQDPLLRGVLVDKPPLAFYLNALGFALLGPTELAARLPAFFSGVVSVAVLFVLARRLYGPAEAHLAAWLLALSPFAILFSITSFTDPLLCALGLAALWAALTGRARLAATLLALAFAVKQTALIFLPLMLAFSLLSLPAAATPRQALRRMIRLAGPLAAALLLTTLLVVGWDLLRQAPVGFWAQGYGDNIPGRLIRAGEVLPRARAWLGLLGQFTAAPPLNQILLLSLPLLWLMHRRAPSRAALADILLITYLLLYLAAYWLLAFNVWDRYLLPLVPLVMLLLARVLRLAGYSFAQAAHPVRAASPGPPPLPLCSRGASRGRDGLAARRWELLTGLAPALRRGLPFALCLLLTAPALTAARSGYPIGGDHGAYDGIDLTAQFLRTRPEGGVLYDHWLGWEWSFYLFDGPLYVAWFPNPGALRDDLRAFGQSSPRYLVIPAWESEAEVRQAAAEAGFRFVPLHTARRRDGVLNFTTYQLVSDSPP